MQKRFHAGGARAVRALGPGFEIERSDLAPNFKDLAAESWGDVLFVDTGYHFPETLATRDALERRYPQVRFVTLNAGATRLRAVVMTARNVGSPRT